MGGSGGGVGGGIWSSGCADERATDVTSMVAEVLRFRRIPGGRGTLV